MQQSDSTIQRKKEQLRVAENAVFEWCTLNGHPCPRISVVWEPRSRRNSGIYYSKDFRSSASVIRIFPTHCNMRGPIGSIGDHSVYGVMMHELGHHVDGYRYASTLKRLSPVVLTPYSKKNIHENFAETFRVYVSNPDLLRVIRPRAYLFLSHLFPHHLEMRPWHEVLPEGTEEWAYTYRIVKFVKGGVHERERASEERVGVS